MTKTLWELQQDLQEAELAALSSIADAASAAADININTEENKPFMEVLSKGQEDRLLAQAQAEVLREARGRGKDLYVEAHLVYVSQVQQRRAELVDALFGKATDASVLATAALANEEALKRLARVAAATGNEVLGQSVLLSAYEGEEPIIHELIQILDVDSDDEDEEGTLAQLFNELAAIDQVVVEDVNVYGEELKVRYDLLVENPTFEDLMPGSSKRQVLLGSR